ncbi:hypothetical protein GCM10023206_31070 [Acinetobacter puyangensis]|uniref:Alpha-acetolactate decarboxylase n=1 Tax=Acinetobacter puyangensis TaxID=1096779 RepID=A0A240E3K9_9GAMM|nr:acetolactate decarboxylase [Acinetobacter puyangensis]SNX43126.1 alpha-acetolactate decarboxylase [Acinetobacter puyangensis]
MNTSYNFFIALFILVNYFVTTTTVYARDHIYFQADEAIYPEGIAYDATTDTFIVSSMKKGKLGRVDREGNYQVFADDKSLISSHGIQIDTKRNRVLVCVGDNGISKRSDEKTTLNLARVVEFELSSGKLKRVIELTNLATKYENHLANDLTIDEEGNAYVTDSFAPVIYKIPLNGTPSIFISMPKFTQETSQASGLEPNLNGILYHPNGFLIAANWRQGTLWRIPIHNPDALNKIEINSPVQGIDGLTLISQNTLATIQSYRTAHSQLSSKISILESEDNWYSAKIIQRHNNTPFMNLPTTATLANGNLYFLNSQYAELFSKQKSALQRHYNIGKISGLTNNTMEKMQETSRSNKIFQISIVDAFLTGQYDGMMHFGEVKKYGDFGLGAFDQMDGEMLAFDGDFFQIKSDGKAYPVTNKMLTPQSFVTFFKPEKTVQLKANLTKNNFDKWVLEHMNKNQIYAIRIDGIFDVVKTRSNPPQEKPYQPLVKVIQSQNTFDLNSVRGTLVGYRMPDFMSRLNVPGVHLHFIDENKTVGGHVLDFKMKSGVMQMARMKSFEFSIPNNDDFNKIDFKIDRSQEINKAE